MKNATKQVIDRIVDELVKECPLPKVKAGVKAGNLEDNWAPYGLVKPVPANLR